jgi:MYXO-CTERM domain-containing protein
MKMKMKTIMALIASIGLSSGATILNIDATSAFQSGATPAADAPWVTITATTLDTRANGASADFINLNIKASSEWNDPSEFISRVVFSLNDGIVSAGGDTSFRFGNFTDPAYAPTTDPWALNWSGPSSLDVRPGAVLTGINGTTFLDGGVEFYTLSTGNRRFNKGKSFDVLITHTGSEALTDENIFGDDPIAAAYIYGITYEGKPGRGTWAQSTSVPEPSSALLGLLGLGAFARRKR